MATNSFYRLGNLTKEHRKSNQKHGKSNQKHGKSNYCGSPFNMPPRFVPPTLFSCCVVDLEWGTLPRNLTRNTGNQTRNTGNLTTYLPADDTHGCYDFSWAPNAITSQKNPPSFRVPQLG